MNNSTEFVLLADGTVILEEEFEYDLNQTTEYETILIPDKHCETEDTIATYIWIHYNR